MTGRVVLQRFCLRRRIKRRSVSCVCMPLRLRIYLHKIAVLRTALLDAFSGQRTHHPRINKPGLRGQTLLQIHPTKIAILGVRAVSKSAPLRRIRAWGPCFRFAGHEHIRNHLNLGYERPKPMNYTTSGDDGALVFKVWVETCNFQSQLYFGTKIVRYISNQQRPQSCEPATKQESRSRYVMPGISRRRSQSISNRCDFSWLTWVRIDQS